MSAMRQESSKIVFAADNHYDQHPGAVLHDAIGEGYDMAFFEDDWSGLADGDLMGACDLLMLNMISGSCGVDPPGREAQWQVATYLQGGGNVLLLHGASAAFWQWDWWRPIVGHRWVRPDDPDGFPPSAHPIRPYRLDVSTCRHPLCESLQPADVPADEIYTHLEQTCPTTWLMQTTIDEGTFVQCYEATTPGSGTLIGRFVLLVMSIFARSSRCSLHRSSDLPLAAVLLRRAYEKFRLRFQPVDATPTV